MVLVLIGVLSAIAVPKYFDLQAEAIAKKCQHNRGAVQSSVLTRFAADQLDGTAADWAKNGNDKIQQMMREDFRCSSGWTNGSPCEQLCEAGGGYKVHFTQTDGNLVVSVECTYHTGNDSSETPTHKQVSEGDISGIINWLEKFYMENITGVTGNGNLDFKSLNDFFSKWSQGAIDSDALGMTFDSKDNYGDYSSMTDAVLASMEKELNLRSDDVIWTMTRSGKCTTGGNTCNWNGKIWLTVVKRPDSVTNGMSITATRYEFDLSFKSNKEGGGLKSLTPGSSSQIDVILKTEGDQVGNHFTAIRNPDGSRVIPPT